MADTNDTIDTMAQKMGAGARNALINCLETQPSDRVLIVTDLKTNEVGDVLASEAKKITNNVKVLLIEDFTPRPAITVSTKMVTLAGNFRPTISIYAAQGYPGELPVFRRPLTELFIRKLKCKHAHMISISKELMADGVNKDYDLVFKVTGKVAEKAKKAKKIYVTDPHGTDITYELDPKIKWVLDNGKIQPGEMHNIPSGELYTCPKNVTGVFAGWILGDYMSEKYGELAKPLIVTIKNGFITEIEGIPDIKADFENYVSEFKNGNKVGELGIGTLVGLDHFVGNLLQDEKYPGVHMAFGNPYPHETGADWTAESHIDMVAKDTTITLEYTDGKQETIMTAGQFSAAILGTEFSQLN